MSCRRAATRDHHPLAREPRQPRHFPAVKHLAFGIWGLAIGAVVLDVFFSVIAGISPLEIAGVTVAVSAICVVWLVRSMRLEFELRSRAGDPQLRAEHNRARERRGF